MARRGQGWGACPDRRYDSNSDSDSNSAPEEGTGAKFTSSPESAPDNDSELMQCLLLS